MKQSRPVLRFVLLVLSVALLAPVGARGAEPETGLLFRDQRPVALESTNAERTRPVVLCNVSGAPATGLRGSLDGFQFTNGGEAVADEKVVSLSATPSRLEPGACESVTITLEASPEIDAGPFTGELVVTSAGSGVARLEISVSGPASTVVSTQGAAATVELGATRKLLFSESVSIDGGSALALKAPPKGRDLEVPPEGSFIGNLVNGGDVASVYVTGKPDKSVEGVWLLPIEVRGAAHTGDYEGTLTPTTSSSEKETVKAKVIVTDWWVWAVLAVLLGAGIVVLPTLYVRRWRLESTLHDRHRALAAAYDAAGKKFHTHDGAAGITPPSTADVERYARAIDAAIRAYAESTWYFDTTSSAYSKIVESLEVAEADVECLEDESGLVKALGELDGSLKRLADQLGKHLPIERQPAIALAASALLRPECLAVGEATVRARKAKEALDGIERWTDLAQALRRCEVWYRVLQDLSVPDTGRKFSAEDLVALQEIYASLGKARNELLEAADVKALHRLKVRKRLDRIYGRLALLGASYNRWVVSQAPPEGSEQDWPALKIEIDGELHEVPGAVHREIAAVQQELPSAITDAQGWLKNADTLVVSAAKPVELGRTKRFVGDAMVVALSVATGTVASLSAFYFGKPFGTIEDFLTVIFVGTAAQAFLKPVTDVLAQLRGSTEPVTKSDPQKASAASSAQAIDLAAGA
jgi:hypothetical protein